MSMPPHDNRPEAAVRHPRRTGDAAVARNVVLAAVFAAVAAFLMFSPTIGYKFLRYDDEIYISNNLHLRPLTADNLVWMFTHPYFESYTPLALLSHALDARLWGDDARGHHLTNVMLHALNTALVLMLSFLVISASVRRPGGGADVRAGLWGAVIAALMFALHPLRVESVAWVSDRKDLLMGFFVFSSLLMYTLYALQSGAPRAVRWRRAALVLFILAILSKSAALVTPLVMVVLDFVVRRDAWANVRGLLKEKSWFFVVMILGGLVAFQASGEMAYHYAIEHLTTGEKLLLPFYSAAFFLFKFLWPHPLVPIYTAPENGMLAIGVAVSLAITAGVVVLAARKRTVLPLLAWVSYLVVLVPVLAGVSAGIQPWADRYTYVPFLGPIILAGGWVGALRSRSGRQGWAAVPVIGSAVAIAICALLSAQQMPYWADSLVLWKHAESHAPESGPLILVPLGTAYHHAGQPDSAIAMYRRAVAVEPRYAQAYFSMGEAFASKGETGTAVELYLETLRRDSSHVGAKNDLAGIYLNVGRMPEAIGLYRRLVAAEPDNAQFRNNLGFALMRAGDAPAAVTELRTAIRTAPGFKSPYVHLGVLYQDAGEPGRAAEILQQALAIDANDPNINYNLAIALEALGKFREAEASYRRALTTDPRLTDAWINLGNLIARMGRLQEAREMYEQVIAATPESAELCLNLAAIYSALGEREGALRRLEEAVKRKPDFAAAYYAMGLFYSSNGDTVAARQSFQIASRYGSKEAAARLGSASPSRVDRR